MNTFLDRLKDEPALVTGFVSAVLVLAVAFGLPLSEVQAGAIVGLVIAAQALVTRAKVTPTRKVRLRRK